MMKPETALIQFQSWAQEESQAQARLLEALVRMEAASRSSSQEELAQGCEQIEAALNDGQFRAERRRMLTGVLGQHFGVSPATLSLGSIIERAQSRGMGPAPVLSALRGLRTELIERAREVSRQATRMAAVAGHQRGLLHELLGILGVRPADEQAAVTGGGLVNAEA